MWRLLLRTSDYNCGDRLLHMQCILLYSSAWISSAVAATIALGADGSGGAVRCASTLHSQCAHAYLGSWSRHETEHWIVPSDASKNAREARHRATMCMWHLANWTNPLFPWHFCLISMNLPIYVSFTQAIQTWLAVVLVLIPGCAQMVQRVGEAIANHMPANEFNPAKMMTIDFIRASPAPAPLKARRRGLLIAR